MREKKREKKRKKMDEMKKEIVEFAEKVAEAPFEPRMVKGGSLSEIEAKKEVQRLSQNLARLRTTNLRGRILKLFSVLIQFSVLEHHMEHYGTIPPIPEGVENLDAEPTKELAKQHIANGTVEKKISMIFRTPISWEHVYQVYGGCYTLLLDDFLGLPRALMMENESEKIKAELKDWAKKGGSFNHDIGARLFIIKHMVEVLDGAIENRPLPEFQAGLIRLGEINPLTDKIRGINDRYNALDDPKRLEVLKKFSQHMSSFLG